MMAKIIASVVGLLVILAYIGGCSDGTPKEEPKGTQTAGAASTNAPSTGGADSTVSVTGMSDVLGTWREVDGDEVIEFKEDGSVLVRAGAIGLKGEYDPPVLMVEGFLGINLIYDVKVAGDRLILTDSDDETTEYVRVVTPPSGLQYIDIREGTGLMPVGGDRITVHYTGWLTDGTKFDSSVDRGTPFDFTISEGQVIAGWDEGIATMKAGGKRRLIIPPDLAYGEAGAGPIPSNATLIFDVELLDIR